MRRTLSISLAALAAALCSLPLVAPSAHAGCGCDHPPPAWALVMPPFASPGKEITVFAEGGAFTAGATYEVDFGTGARTFATATVTDRIEVSTPPDVRPGPVRLRVRGPGYDHEYGEALFTALPPAPAMPAEEGVYLALGQELPVTADGTLLLPLDLNAVVDPTQFAFFLSGLPLRFGHEDVVIYNADGVDLTLFTLEVEDPTERQWGSYYGWEVEEDGGLVGTVFEGKVGDSLVERESDVFTYWRHEFQTYKDAHAPGGSHEVDENGRHPDGTLHVDHDHLVIAITGHLGEGSDATPLAPGSERVHVVLGALYSEHPIELEELLPRLDNPFGWQVLPTGDSGSTSGSDDDDDGDDNGDDDGDEDGDDD